MKMYPWPSICVTWIFVLAVSSCYRLPTDVIPEHYRLEILTYLGEPDNFNYDGKVWIQTNCLSPTKNITLHSKKLDIDRKDVVIRDISSSDSKAIKVEKIDEQKDHDFVIFQLDQMLLEDHKYEIYIAFKGELVDGLLGFYRSSYNSKCGKKWLGVTQFEAISARNAFPCFDEPAMKATFDISLGRKEGYSSISNMPIAKTEPVKEKIGWFWDRFENSVPMSTYLVAFVVSDFGYKTAEPLKNNNVTFRIWARKDALSQVDFAKDVGPKALDYYENFFDIKYPLPKQDMIAIPDFSSGAMENWGLITYREAYLLFDPEVSSTTSQHGVASVISHELAHQWFGNLVTMKWWTDLWLNEGFATYMASLAVDHLFPHWNSLQEEAVSNLLNVFSFDSLQSSHPVSVPINNPNEISEIFDTISYKKGSFVIRMMSLFLGEETLRKGVSNYLIKHKYGNAEQDDLWESLTAEAHKNSVLPNNLTVKTIMDTWTRQTGYPVITVNRDYAENTAHIAQKRFLKDSNTKDDSSCWWVPLTYTDQKEKDFETTRPKKWLSCSKNDKQIIENLPDKNTWILFNIKASGIYKINYDEQNWKLLISTLKSDNYKSIPNINRVQLIDDAADLAWTGVLKYDLFFELLKYLKSEDEYLPWKAALTNINALNRHLKKTPIYGNFKNYMKQLLSPIYEKVGGLKLNTNNKDRLDSIKHQVLVVGWACKFGVANCVADAKALFDKWETNLEQSNPVPKDFRSVIYCTVIRNGGEKEWDFIWRQYLKSNVATEKSTILSTLGCSRELWLLNRYLDWTLNEKSGIRKQDITSVFGAVASNDVGYYLAKNFFFNNIEKIHKYLSVETRRLGRYLSSIASQTTTQKDYEELEKFIETNKKHFSEIKKGVQQSLETSRLNVQWQERHLGAIHKLLESSGGAK